MQSDRKIRILWTDDEIDLLKSHILFLESKGYEVITSSNGYDAIKLVTESYFDLIFLDEHMPGLSGLETLNRIKQVNNSIPVVMITKNEEENIIDTAIGSRISDYLIKPVHPKQILLTIKKNVNINKLITRETTHAYQGEFHNLGAEISGAKTYTDWETIYKKLVFWELELETSKDPGMYEVLQMQKSEARQGFGKFIRSSYISWFRDGNTDKPLLSPAVFREKVFPLLKSKRKVFLIVIDNLRLDHWKVLYPVISEYYIAESEQLYCSILPTATQYARNSMFAGIMPLDISHQYPGSWINDDNDQGKNLNEEELLKMQLKRNGIQQRMVYYKTGHERRNKKLSEQIPNLLQYDLIVIVYNFIDLLSHANTELEMIREVTGDDAAYRSLVLSWFRHSQLHDFLRILSEKDVSVVITTDHGAVRVGNAIKVIGDKRTSSNLRYKTGKNLNYTQKEVFEIKDPHVVHLPKQEISSSYIFCSGIDFFAYPNRFNHYVNYYKNTFQHGGISMEEMLVPLIVLNPR